MTGNVIGGGDFAKDRIIPDCVRAVQDRKPIIVRNPYSVRPYQHVLEPLFAYLLIAEKQYTDPEVAGCYNIGPNNSDCITTGALVNLFCELWGEGADWTTRAEAAAPHEAGLLKLDCSLAEKAFGWKPKWHIDECMEQVVRFSKVYLSKGNIEDEMDAEIRRYLS